MASKWKTARFEDVFDFKGGSQPPKSEFINQPRQGYVRLLQIRDFEDESNAVYIKDQKKWPKCTENDIMIGRYGASVGKVLGGKSGAYNVALVRLIFDPSKVHQGWARHFCRSSYFQEPLKNISRSAQNGFNKEDLAGIEFPFPSFDEQRAIAKKLDSLLRRTGGTREHLVRIPRLVERYKQAILSAASSGDLTSKWRRENGLSQPKCTRLDTLVAVPIRNGFSVRGSDDPPGIRSLRLSALRGRVVDLDDVRFLPITANEAERFLLRGGDVLVSRGNGTKSFVGIAALVQQVAQPTIFPDTAFRIRLAPLHAKPAWFTSIWNAPQVRKQIESAAKTTAGIWKVSQSDLSQIELLLPSLEEQDEIYKRIDAAFASIEKVVAESRRAVDLLNRCEQAILTKAFRGELVEPQLTVETEMAASR
jgi:type I restriction enzyme S subunit